MNTIGFTSLLKTKTNNVYADFVPEKKPLPAVSFTHLANGGSRILKGNRSGLWDTWRVMCIGKNRSESESIAKSIKELDNSKSSDFNNIFVIADGNVTASPEDKTRVSYVDIKTYG